MKGAVADDPAILGKGVGVGLRKGEDDLKAKFNAGIAKVIVAPSLIGSTILTSWTAKPVAFATYCNCRRPKS